MKSLLPLLVLGCTEYELSSPLEKHIPPDTAEEVFDVPMAPVAVAGPSDSMKRGAIVQLSGTQSYDPDNEMAQLIYEWSIVDSPVDSTPFLDAYNVESPFFSADKVGRYVIMLTVTDEDGLISESPSATMIEVKPYENLRIELTWDAPGMDLDLHLVQENGTYYGDGDCYFGNPTPDWGESGNIMDNPNLAFDDEGMEARESIEINEPVEQKYAVYALFYNRMASEEPNVTPTITIWAEGSSEVIQAGETCAQLNQPNDNPYTGPRIFDEGAVWVAGILDWENLTFECSTLVTDNVSLGGPSYND
jgi:hypothetical protein